jgi:hypothetical protein
MITTIEKTLIEAASIKLNFDENEGLEAGHNGPYFDKETPVRNTAHWLVIFSCLFKRTGDVKYKYAAFRAINYLKSQDARPMMAAFFCRKKIEKDYCNGLMGQAWVIEALMYAYNVFKDETLYELAEETFRLHQFDETRMIWHRLSVDGSCLSFDNTFNHQLWFCAVGSMLFKSEDIIKNCNFFFEHIASQPELYRSGVIYHNSSIFKLSIEKNKGIKCLIEYAFNTISNLKSKSALHSKSVGYHGFNLYAYELLKSRYGEHSFFSSKKYRKMLDVAQSASFADDLIRSDYSYPYNPPAFEIGFSLLNNGYMANVVVDMLETHFSITSSGNYFNSFVSSDIETSEARLYELVRILDLEDISFELKKNK